jgi:hypothetical protein
MALRLQQCIIIGGESLEPTAFSYFDFLSIELSFRDATKRARHPGSKNRSSQYPEAEALVAVPERERLANLHDFGH